MALPAVMKSTSAKVMKAMKAMKKTRESKVAKGRLAKSMVFRGKKEKTVGGLKQESLMKNKRGKVVSKKASARGKLRFKQIEPWVDAVMAAREALHATGFVAINGKSLKGRALYVKAKQIHSGTASSAAAAAAPGGA
eukprot:TRINITY_DN9817_c0_g2_i1.p2 TRINITY_DN9817_c0_g2~~TRINITY_DN9817_c0_g2_i1.p2  ORF type:complete len:156 (+),score=46.10 TRINITY_DN9817_c0_g2_i1:59-469(+)